ncbi:MAG: hypothetical protein JW993_01880 [Sedimentisphaerales bacterium]|nr:hypothetical protein [Sedimentisphaerales bacterium]
MQMSMLTVSVVLWAAQAGGARSWDFEGLTEGTLPDGWKVEATGQDTPTAKWQAVQDPTAPLAPGALQLAATNHTERGVFNLCWTDAVTFSEGEIAVFLKANSGQIDQGGGPIWRVQDRNNYYISRYNPLEKNVSIYYTKDGRRVMLGYTGTIELPDGWHLLKISHRGQRIRAYLDGDMKLMVNAGDYLPEPGGVGLWTKADAATTFDNFTVIPR